jgi:hypothetical protein
MLTTQQWVGLLCLLRGEEPRSSGRGHPIDWPWWAIAGLALWAAYAQWPNRRVVHHLRTERWPKPFRALLPRRLRRRVPDESTLSRRFRSPKLASMLRRVLYGLAIPTTFGAVDGMVLRVGPHSRDSQARYGGPGSQFQRGYKSVRLVNALGQSWNSYVASADRNEIPLAREVVLWLSQQGLRLNRIGADLGYDSEPLRRDVAEHLHALLVAPSYPRGRGRKTPKSYATRSGRYRQRALRLLKTPWGKHWSKKRLVVERSNGWLRQAPHNLGWLPPFVRGTVRVAKWVLCHEVLLSYRKRIRLAV